MTIFTLDGETNEKDRLLSCLMEWTTEPRLIAAMIKRGRADFPGIAMLASMVRATLDEEDRSKLVTPEGEDVVKPEGEVEPLSERQLAASILAFLTDSDTRNLLARFISITKDVPYDKAKEDLYSLRVHLASTYVVAPSEIPSLMAGDPELVRAAQEQVAIERMMSNEQLSYDPTGAKPDWMVEYEQSDATIVPEGVEFLRGLVPEQQALARQFPPYSLVMATNRAVLCPRPGQVAFVLGYEFEEASKTHVVQVSPWMDDDAPMALCCGEWLELVTCRGQMTREAVAFAMEPDRIQVDRALGP